MLDHSAGHHTTVLIADFNDASARQTASSFERSGYHALTVGTGAEVIHVVGQNGVKLALLSLEFPDLSGYAIAEALRGLAFPVQPILVAVDVYADDTRRFKAADAGFDLYLSRLVDHSVFELLPSLLRERTRFQELKAEQAEILWEYIYLQIEMGHTLLKVASTTTNVQTRSHAFSKARDICRVVARNIDRVSFERAVLVDALRELQWQCDKARRAKG